MVARELSYSTDATKQIFNKQLPSSARTIELNVLKVLQFGIFCGLMRHSLYRSIQLLLKRKFHVPYSQQFAFNALCKKCVFPLHCSESTRKVIVHEARCSLLRLKLLLHRVVLSERYDVIPSVANDATRDMVQGVRVFL